jgi:hypothetical protein
MQVQIVNVDIEVGKHGPKGWSKAVVDYMVNGQTRKQNIMSFTNPQVYKDVTSGKFTGETVEVSITKNAKGYDEWAAISLAGASNAGSVASATPPASGSATAPTRVTGSNYETPVERARRQVLIVRQSSLTAALAFLKETERLGPDVPAEAVTQMAQHFTDWVFDEGEADGSSD